jgi:hypothetical protein
MDHAEIRNRQVTEVRSVQLDYSWRLSADGTMPEGGVGRVKRRPDMPWNKAEQANIAAKDTRQATDEPTLEPSFDPLVKLTHDAPKKDRNLESLGPMSAGMAQRIKRKRSNNP